jgi:hypothetical protein
MVVAEGNEEVVGKAKAGPHVSGLHKEGRRRFGGILSLLQRYAEFVGWASGEHLTKPSGAT